jgi:H+/Cl- antiporter ClcA
MSHVMPMVCASQFSILGGGSLGPEAPLVAICAALGGYVSRKVFKRKNRNLIRKHTLMGMAGALAAFFGSPLGGSLFALEVNSRFGVEYFEHMVEAIFCGEVTLVVFRSLANLPIAPIWIIETPKLDGASGTNVVSGAIIGLLGAFVAMGFAKFHWKGKNFLPQFFVISSQLIFQLLFKSWISSKNMI